MLDTQGFGLVLSALEQLQETIGVYYEKRLRVSVSRIAKECVFV